MSRIHRLWHASMVAVALAVAPGMLASVSRAAPQDLLVSSRLTDSVLRYDGATGDFLGEFVTEGSGGLDVPFGVTFGPDRNLYVGSGGSSPRVKRYDGATGAFIDDFTQVLPAPVALIAFEPDGNLYGVSGSVVFRCDGTTGAFIDNFVDLGLGDLATGFTFGPDGNFYVASFLANHVERFDGTTGDFIDVFAQVPLAGSDGNAGQTAFGPDGNLYVGLPNTGNDVLQFDGSTGDLLKAFIPELDTHPDGPLGFVFGPDGNLYVPSRDSDQVLRYDGGTGAFIDVFASGGGLDEPANVVFVPEPAQVLLVLTGVLVLAAAGRRRAA